MSVTPANVPSNFFERTRKIVILISSLRFGNDNLRICKQHSKDRVFSEEYVLIWSNSLLMLKDRLHLMFGLVGVEGSLAS